MPATPWFGRDETLNLLRKRVEGFLNGFRQNCALLGPEGVGKTTLVRRFLQQELKSAAVLCIYVEVCEESVAEWTRRVAQAVIFGALQKKGISECPIDLPQLLQVGGTFLPDTIRHAQQLLAAGNGLKTEELFDRVWELSHWATKDTGLPCLFVLDEFDRLRHVPVRDPFHRFGRSVMIQNTTMYLLVSSRVQAARETLRTGLRLLFGQFETIDMSCFQPSECLQAIRLVCPHGVLTPFTEHLLMELSQGYPGSLDILLQGLLDRGVTAQAAAQERILLDLLESLFFEPAGTFRVQCEATLKLLPASRSRQEWVDVLLALAQGAGKISVVAQRLGCPPAQVTRALCVLEQLGLVVRRGVFYQIPNQIFQLWMLAAYPLLPGVSLMEPAHVRARFRDAVWGWMEKARQAFEQPMVQRSILFLQQWDGELVDVEGRRMRLPHFQRVERFSGASRYPALLASQGKTGGSPWWVIPWSGALEESHARLLVEEFRSVCAKGCKKLLLGAYPMDLNARLILQEGRIRVWDLKTFSELLDLYGMQRIPCLVLDEKTLHPLISPVDSLSLDHPGGSAASGSMSRQEGSR